MDTISFFPELTAGRATLKLVNDSESQVTVDRILVAAENEKPMKLLPLGPIELQQQGGHQKIDISRSLLSLFSDSASGTTVVRINCDVTPADFDSSLLYQVSASNGVLTEFSLMT
jgi:hypothetical protein